MLGLGAQKLSSDVYRDYFKKIVIFIIFVAHPEQQKSRSNHKEKSHQLPDGIIDLHESDLDEHPA